MIRTRHYILTLALLILGFCSASAQADRQFIRQGNKLFRAGNYVKAEAEYLKAVQKNPNNAQAVYNLGCAMMLQQKDSAAVVQFQKSAQMEKVPLRKSKSFHNIGVICQSKHLYDQAIQAYEESLRLNPTDNETRYNLALCKRQQKKQQQQNKNQQKKQQNKDQKQKQNKDKDQQKQQQKQQQQMSKDNAEQLLNAAMQQEQATQQRLKKAMQQQSNRRLQKNW